MIDFSSLDLKQWKALFRKEPERIGLEVEGRSVRIARVVEGSDGGFVLSSFGDLDIDLRHASVMEQQRFRSAMRQIGGGLTRVAVSIEHPTLCIRKMVFAKMPDSDLREAIRWNFREQVEGSIDQYVVGFTPLDEYSEANRIALMAFGLSQEAIKEHIALMKSLGLKAVSLEPVATALLASFHMNGILSDGNCHVCVAFGNMVTQFIVMRGRSLLFSRPLSGINGEALLKLVMQNLNLDEGHAREALSSWMKGKAEESAEGALPGEAAGLSEQDRIMDATVGQLLSLMVIEVQRSVDAFCIMYAVDRVEDLYVCGSGVYYPGLVTHMQKTLGIETRIFNPFKRLLPPERQTADVVRRAPLYAVAVGLAIA
ncbi:MAG: pilus assembly protein PilM [Pseudomonadota bacterium]